MLHGVRSTFQIQGLRASRVRRCAAAAVAVLAALDVTVGADAVLALHRSSEAGVASPSGLSALLRQKGGSPSGGLGMAERRGKGRHGVDVVVGMGDSVPAGTACECATYVDLLAQALRQRGMGTRAVNDAQPGATSTELLRFVTSHQVRAAPDQVTVITIGANDFDATRVADRIKCASA